MLGRYLSIQNGMISFSPPLPHVSMFTVAPSGEDSFAAAAMSLMSVAPISEANSTPIRSGGTLPFDSPALATASCEPITPNSTVRAIDLSSLRYLVSAIIDLATKPCTSPAIDVGSSEASSSEIVRTPLVPARRACQNASGVEPMGLRTPNPVSTVRRELLTIAATRRRTWGGGRGPCAARIARYL